MAPVRSIKFQTANFPIFCARITVIFCTTCIANEAFSLVIMRNVTHILPVLHCLKRGIAFVSSCSTLLYYKNSIRIRSDSLQLYSECI